MATIKAPVPKEDDEQASVISYLLFRKNNLGDRLRWHHSPNGDGREKKVGRDGKRYCPSGQRLAAQGTSPGFPDLVVFLDGPGDVVFQVAIEMKRRNGRPSDVKLEQREWLSFLALCGWQTRACFGAQEAINFLRECGI
jgi:hypothetical protein